MSPASIVLVCFAVLLWTVVAVALLLCFHSEYLRDQTDWRDQLACIFWPIAIPACWVYDIVQRRRRNDDR